MSEQKDLILCISRFGKTSERASFRICILLTMFVNYVNFAHKITKINDTNNPFMKMLAVVLFNYSGCRNDWSLT